MWGKEQGNTPEAEGGLTRPSLCISMPKPCEIGCSAPFLKKFINLAGLGLSCSVRGVFVSACSLH